uniref:Mitochodrial transcription termination factor n=1 Tax=Globodera pallida TaxID=36090 RepID=A0A183BUP5_GLOPA
MVFPGINVPGAHPLSFLHYCALDVLGNETRGQPTPYANYSHTIQMLLELGVDLFDVCQAPKIGRALLRLDPVRDVKWKIFWLVKRVGVPEADVGSYLSRNPYFLLQSYDDLKDLDLRKLNSNNIDNNV